MPPPDGDCERARHDGRCLRDREQEKERKRAIDVMVESSGHHANLHPCSHPSPPVPDVFPNASNICTLLIKLGDTFKKVC